MMERISLYGLAFACYLFPLFEKRYGSAYEIFINKTKPVFDIHNSEHRAHLLEWLNEWGCRQFETNYHKEISEELSKWSLQYEGTLPTINQRLLDMSEKEIDEAAEAYNTLLQVSFPCSTGKKTAGPTGASKILFALRKEVYPIWDKPMREEYRKKGCFKYNEYMKRSRNELLELNDDCRRNGLTISELPSILNREQASLLKLLDEYHWVSITQKVVPPSAGKLQKWYQWARLTQGEA